MADSSYMAKNKPNIWQCAPPSVIRASRMAQWVKRTTATPDNLTLIPGMSLWKKRPDSGKCLLTPRQAPGGVIIHT